MVLVLELWIGSLWTSWFHFFCCLRGTREIFANTPIWMSNFSGRAFLHRVPRRKITAREEKMLILKLNNQHIQAHKTTKMNNTKHAQQEEEGKEEEGKELNPAKFTSSLRRFRIWIVDSGGFAGIYIERCLSLRLSARNLGSETI